MTSELQGDKNRPSGQHGDQHQAHVALVHKMAEPLTAISSYLHAAAGLLAADNLPSRRQLVEIVEKSQAQAARARETLEQMRDLLHKK